ncbi:unnamed protein product [Phytophthora lilii]|uniref:Unnamed protein product n=1 Tax=Phytophthora lilii TaxID=2077276 RepID=A0A9W6TAE7_9STRA|nr:unnamed protein product [Phytophthora lilii]
MAKPKLRSTRPSSTKPEASQACSGGKPTVLKSTRDPRNAAIKTIQTISVSWLWSRAHMFLTAGQLQGAPYAAAPACIVGDEALTEQVSKFAASEAPTE